MRPWITHSLPSPTHTHFSWARIEARLPRERGEGVLFRVVGTHSKRGEETGPAPVIHESAGNATGRIFGMGCEIGRPEALWGNEALCNRVFG